MLSPLCVAFVVSVVLSDLFLTVRSCLVSSLVVVFLCFEFIVIVFDLQLSFAPWVFLFIYLFDSSLPLNKTINDFVILPMFAFTWT